MREKKVWMPVVFFYGNGKYTFAFKLITNSMKTTCNPFLWEGVLDLSAGNESSLARSSTPNQSIGQMVSAQSSERCKLQMFLEIIMRERRKTRTLPKSAIFFHRVKDFFCVLLFYCPLQEFLFSPIINVGFRPLCEQATKIPSFKGSRFFKQLFLHKKNGQRTFCLGDYSFTVKARDFLL